MSLWCHFVKNRVIPKNPGYNHNIVWPCCEQTTYVLLQQYFILPHIKSSIEVI